MTAIVFLLLLSDSFGHDLYFPIERRDGEVGLPCPSHLAGLADEGEARQKVLLLDVRFDGFS